MKNLMTKLNDITKEYIIDALETYIFWCEETIADSDGEVSCIEYYTGAITCLEYALNEIRIYNGSNSPIDILSGVIDNITKWKSELAWRMYLNDNISFMSGGNEMYNIFAPGVDMLVDVRDAIVAAYVDDI